MAYTKPPKRNKFGILLVEGEGGSVRGRATYNGQPVTREMWEKPPTRLFRAGIAITMYAAERYGIPISIDQEDIQHD